MLKNSIKIKKSTPIILYGAAAHGLRGYHSLKEINGYNVVGFMDKRAKEIKTQFGLPVWNIEDVPFEKDKILVVICVKNVYEHEKIVKILIEENYRYFIFKPIQNLKQKDNKEFFIVNKNYDSIFNDKNHDLKYELMDIPKMDKISCYFYKDYALIARKSGGVIVNLPIQRIYVEMSETTNILFNKEYLSNSYALYPHILLFRFFGGDLAGGIKHYIDFCLGSVANTKKMYGDSGGCIIPTYEWKKNVVRNRKDVYHNMKMNLQINPGFFTENVLTVNIEENGIIRANSGKHRIAFYIAEGFSFIPVRLSEVEYEQLLNKKICEELQTFLEQHSINQIQAMIPHPFFYQFPCTMEGYDYIFVSKAILWLSTQMCQNNWKPEDFIVYDELQDGGTFARCIRQMGFQVYKRILGRLEYSFLKLIDALVFVNGINYVNDRVSADVLCYQGVPPKRLNDEVKMVFWIQNEEDVSFFEKDTFVIEKLFCTIWDGKIHEGYCACRKSFKKGN